MEKGYNYIGIHYDVLGRNIGINDKKYGVTLYPDKREKALSRTKSPIQYMFIKLYEFESQKYAETAEQLCHYFLKNKNTNGEWFQDDDETLVNEIELIHNHLKNLGVQIKEIDLGKSPILTDIEKKQLEVLDRKQLNKEFNTTLKLVIDSKCNIFEKINPTTDPWFRKSYRRQGFILVQSKTYARMELYIDGGEKEENEKLFYSLKENKKIIESELGYELKWEALEEVKSCRISYSIDGNVYDKTQWVKMIDFMSEHIPNFYNTMCKYIDQSID
jgi:hypothetical protein